VKPFGTPAIQGAAASFFVIRGNAALVKAESPPKTLFMNTSKPGTADVIRSVGETLDVICAAQGIEVRDLDDAMIEKLLWISFEEQLGSGAACR
jgi:hypothetical protein